MNVLRLLLSTVIAITILGCEETPDTANHDSINESGFFAIYDPAAGKLPFPSNLLFTGTDASLTLNIPPSADDTAGVTAVKAALNDLDGFSTVAPITIDFSSAIDSTSLIGQDTVRVFKVGLSGFAGAVVSVTSELVVDVDYALSVSTVDSADGAEKGANKLVISPLKPLEPKTSYMVVVTNGVKGVDGDNAASSVPYALTKGASDLHTAGTSNFLALTDTEAQSLEPLRVLNNTSEVVGLSSITDLAASDIVVSFSFTTQSITDVLVAQRAVIQGMSPVVDINPTSVGTSPGGAANIFIGTMELPYYLDVPDPLVPATAAAALAGSWRGAGDTALTAINPNLDQTAASLTTLTVPVLITVPTTAKSGLWPVAIFQHGITGNRSNVLGLADTLAGQGYAAVAIDLPLHGLIGDEDTVGAFKAATEAYSAAINSGTAVVRERHFEMDLINNVTSEAGADSVLDESGQHFINLNSLLTTRDNLRQAVSDLMVLTKSIGTIDYDGGGADLDTTNIKFIGHSLGAIVGTTFLAVETNIEDAVLGMPGGGVAKLLDGSATFGPIISAGLGAEGVTKGTAEYESFLASAQMVVDSGDAINYASSAVAARDVLLFEIVGDGVNNLADQVVPNNVIGVTDTVNAPLSGTDPLVSLMSLTQIDTSSTYAPNTDTLVKFSGGHHSSLLTTDLADDTANVDTASVEYKAYVEMQSELATFIASDGASLTATDASVVSAVAP